MNPISLVLFAAFWVNSCIHLLSIYFRKNLPRKITKCFILPLLLVVYIYELRTRGTEPNLYVSAALFFCWLGDVLLLPKGAQFFALGGISFIFGHICLISAYCTNIVFSPFTILIGVVFLFIYISVINIVRNNINDFIPTSLKLPMFAYLIANATMNVFALMQLISAPSTASAYVYIGALVFFYSDVVLFDVHFHNCSFTLKRHVIEMFAYILGECLICYGSILIAH